MEKQDFPDFSKLEGTFIAERTNYSPNMQLNSPFRYTPYI